MNHSFWLFIVFVFAIVALAKLVKPRKKRLHRGVRWSTWRMAMETGAPRSEKFVSRLLSALPEGEYALLDDVMIKTRGGTTQIDHVLVSVYGIFVIETKECNGWVFGDAEQKHWTICYPGGEKHRMYNPLRQNDSHIKHLKTVANINKTPVRSVVVFSGEFKFKTVMPSNVVNVGSLLGYITDREGTVLTQTQVRRLTERIQRKRVPNTKENRRAHTEHVESVKMAHRATGSFLGNRKRYGYRRGARKSARLWRLSRLLGVSRLFKFRL